MVDAWICAKFADEERKAAGHVGMGVLAGALRASMY
jgi:hypothetical protein